MEMKALLPVRASGSNSYEWAAGVRKLLTGLSRGPVSSSVKSGEHLFDCILNMRQESGMEDLPMCGNVCNGLENFFWKLPEKSNKKFFHSTLPSIARLALDLPSLLEQHWSSSSNQFHDFRDMHLRVLPSQQPGMVLLSQELAACLLACSFLCLYPTAKRTEAGLPLINFDKFFSCIQEQRPSQRHKMLCILHYFERVSKSMPQGTVSYERKVLFPLETGSQAHQTGFFLPDENFWSISKAPLCKMKVFEAGAIESHDGEALEVDFANKYLGGGVLGSGCVQEEIRFMRNPELIAGMLFLPVMADNEAIEIIGAECYSNYEGYGKTFSFAGDYLDDKPRDRWGRRMTRIIAIDALPRVGDRQYDSELILREANKAFCGFHRQNPLELDVGVATGNWGCGAFGGDLEIKSMIQWLAASQANRPFMLYYSFADPRAKRMEEIVNWISRKSWTVGNLWHVLVDYGSKRRAADIAIGFFDWLRPVSTIQVLFSRLREFFIRSTRSIGN